MLGQHGVSYMVLSPHHINVSSCQILNAPKRSLRGTWPVPQLELDH